MISVREIIVARFNATGWTISEFSERSGVNRPDLSKYLRGLVDMRGESIDKLLNALRAISVKWGKL